MFHCFLELIALNLMRLFTVRGLRVALPLRTFWEPLKGPESVLTERLRRGLRQGVFDSYRACVKVLNAFLDDI